ncbi:MAG: GDP-mannose 4,6-dehydratase [Candidatus Helarchaeota archaeon]
MEFEDQLKNKNILITGGAGFIGSNIVEKMIEIGANITVYDNFSSGKLENLFDFYKKGLIRLIVGDIRDWIPYSYRNPEEVVEINMNGTLNIILTALEHNIEKMVMISTSEVYGTAQYIPMDENHPLNPHSTYATSKMAADRLCFTIHKEQNFPVIVLRIFNTFGPKETHPYIIPELIKQIVHNKEDKLYLGNIEAKRDFTFVYDTVNAILKASCLDSKYNGEVINIGSNKAYSVKYIAETIMELYGRKMEILIDKKRFRPYDVDHLQSSNEKAKKILNWNPKIEFNEGLEITLNWFLNNGKKWPYEK